MQKNSKKYFIFWNRSGYFHCLCQLVICSIVLSRIKKKLLPFINLLQPKVNVYLQFNKRAYKRSFPKLYLYINTLLLYRHLSLMSTYLKLNEKEMYRDFDLWPLFPSSRSFIYTVFGCVNTGVALFPGWVSKHKVI